MLIPKKFNLQLFADEAPADPESQADAIQDTGGDEREQPQSKVYPEDYVKKLRAENASYRNKYKELEASLNQKQTEFQNNIFKAFGLEPDANKNAEKQITEWKNKAQEAESRANDKLIRAEVKLMASSLGIVSPDAAYKLMDMSDVKIKDDGTVKGVKEALEDLIKENPFLKSQPAAPKKIGSSTNPGSGSVIGTSSDAMNRIIRIKAGYLPG